MIQITRRMLTDELDDAKIPEDIINLIKKYPSRIYASIHFMIDGESYNSHGKDIYLSSMAQIEVEN